MYQAIHQLSGIDKTFILSHLEGENYKESEPLEF